VLTLWSASGPLSSWYEDGGGLLALWRDLATDVTGEAVDGGHFFPEERPSAVAAALSDFFSSRSPNAKSERR
jgi:haloacetate dehalogenase